MGNNKRITFLIGGMTRGGAERVISILANSYAEKGWDVDILTLLNNRCDYILNNKIILHPLAGNKSRIAQVPKWLCYIRKHIYNTKPDVTVAFVASINILTLLATIGIKQRIIISERNDPKEDGRSFLTRIGTRLLYPKADCIVFQTKRAKSFFSRKIQESSKIIPNPINVKSIASSKKQKKIVTVGRLMEQKNHKMLVDAFSRFIKKNKGYKLYIYGEGHLRGSLTKIIEDYSLKDSIFLPGNIANIHEEIADAEFFVLTSNYEGMSNALMEAMAMGLPCISTNCAGSDEIIINKKNGLLVPVGSSQELLNSMELLASNKEYAKQISRGALKTAQMFNNNNVIEMWEQVLEEK